MPSKFCCSRGPALRKTKRVVALALAAADAPPWMHALVNAPVPSYDEKTNAVLLYSETNVTVLATDKIRTQVREAYKILRPEGREYGRVEVYFSPERRIKSLHGWCIPAQGKDFEVRDKDALDVSLSVDGGEILVNAPQLLRTLRNEAGSKIL